DLIKIVTTANSINDNFTVFEFLRNKTNLISFCMSQKGEISRILAPKFNSKITYASMGGEKESAPGQLTLKEMQELYRVNSINKGTNVIGIIGEFAENSMSKYMHNPNFVKNNLNFIYVPFKVSPPELKEFMKNFRKFNFKGAAVTIPHKESIIKLIDELDDTAKQIGAANTLVNNSGKITGYNTDYYGAVHALKEQTEIKNKKTLVIGAGGAGRAIVYGLKKEESGITIANRTNEKAKKLADEFEVQFDNFSNIKKLIKNNDVIINATSVGMSPKTNDSILKWQDLVKGKIVMDIVYKPINTKLINMAKKKGCRAITGDRMLIYQAVRQFELWTKANPGFGNMERELVSAINRTEKGELK
ncbi:shikimate dehydrogenase, partial [Candidatus Woesearchaeota archaeon]|nr:shikimate dehydrogenase [Candidatus Woesearchaeota archaeon]